MYHRYFLFHLRKYHYSVGTAATILSASLGHTNLNTVHQFYLSANHEKASQITNQTIQEITQFNQ